MPILCPQHTYTTYHQFVCYFLVIPIMFNYYKMLNQSYIYKLVWKMQVNCQCYTPDVLRVFTLNLSLQKIQCDYECQLVIYKKPKECKHWILINKCFIFTCFLFRWINSIFWIWLHFSNWYTVLIRKYFWQTSTTYMSQWLIVSKLDSSVHQNIHPWIKSRH